MSVIAAQDYSLIFNKYILPRNNSERDRLDSQHVYLTATVCDGRLLFDSSVQLKAGSRVLDAGTGTGAWTLALADEVPKTVQIDGVDISKTLFPKEYPSNVRFYEESITSLPPSWGNSFDFVNQRLLVGALSAALWKEDLAEMFRVLKPGGAIQLIEIATPYPGGEGLESTEKVLHFVTTLSDRRGLLRDCGNQLPPLLRDAGFTDIRVEKRTAPVGEGWGKVGLRGAENFATTFRGMGVAAMQEGGLGMFQSGAGIDALISQAREEWSKTLGIFFVFHIIRAKKPLVL